MTKKRISGAGRKSRREFLKGALITGGAMAVGLAAGEVVAAPKATPAGAATPPESKGYHVTEHIQDYYKTARG
jgi:anaerobic selenocysteine-containing dehydrogenase